MISNKIFRRGDPNRLPNSTREGILKRDDQYRLIYQKGLVLVEQLYALGIEAGTWLTFDQIFRLSRDNFGSSHRFVYEGLQARLIFQRRKSKPRPHQRGARPYEFCVPNPERMNYEFADNVPAPHDELQRCDLKNLTTFRRAIFGTHIRRLWIEFGGKGVKMFRGFQAERSGISMRTARTYEKQLGFSHTDNYKARQITEANKIELPRFKQKYDAQGKPIPSRKWLRVVEGTTGQVLEILPCVEYLAAKRLREGNLVFEVEREANTYYPYQRPDPSKFEGGEWSVDFYLAEMKAREQAGLYQDSNDRWCYKRE